MSTNCRLMMMVLAGAAWAACGDNHTQPDAPPAPACADGIDNDGDGLIDHPDDPGCSSPEDDDERSPGPACSDGVDNDGDGKTDYPSDPGCLAPNQDDETDDCPDGENCPQCANGIDDDGNGQTDYPDDPGCMAASDPTEYVNNPVACGAGLTIKQLPPTGEDTGMLDATSTSSIVTPCGGGPGTPAYAYLISLAEPSVLVATTEGSAVNTILDLRGANCSAAGAEIACHDDISSTNTASRLNQSLPAGNYYLIVSGADAATTGAYKLEVDVFAGEGSSCTDTANCGPGLVCRTPLGGTTMVCSKPACRDGVDDDQDGKTDFPADPGCDTADDNDEADDCPSGPNCPVCSNGEDDDGDGQTDYPADTSCSAASGASESCSGEDDPILPITSGTLMGTTVGAMNDRTPACGAFNHTAGERVYTITVPQMLTLKITNTNSWDAVVSLYDNTCGGTPVVCSDTPEDITTGPLNAGTYHYIVDGYAANTGSYTLGVSGTIAPGGRCDAAATLGGALACPMANPCEGAPGAMRCRPTVCNDGMDNDGDGLTDYPADPGCESALDETETDTCPGVGPGCPQCADGVDNDGDGLADADDPNCTAPSVPSEGCDSSEPVLTLTQPITTATTTGATNDAAPTCGATTNTAPDQMWSLQVPLMRSLTITHTSSWDAAIALYDSTCGGTALACVDDAISTPEVLTVQNLAPGTYHYLTDGYSSSSGSYTITVSGVIAFGASCEVPLADSGAITCGDGFACTGAPGARRCLLAACRDGIDNDGDGVADFPNDPGCASINDDDETDSCPGAGCPQCSDGIDNDGDMLVDYPFDPNCMAASTDSEACVSSEGLTPIVLPMTSGTTVNATDDFTPSCGSSSNTAGDRLYSIKVPALMNLSIVNTNTFDAAVALLDSSCGGAPLACSDEPETIGTGPLAAGTYYYVVDGYSSATGPYSFTVSGTIAPGGSCNPADTLGGALQCPTGLPCEGMAGDMRCRLSACIDGIDNDGDGKTDYPNEPGCDSILDDDEADPATAPECSNGLDDDTDGQTDYPADMQCRAASWGNEACVQSEAVVEIVGPTTTGTTLGAVDDVDPICTNSSTETAGDVAFKLQIPGVTTLTIANSNSFDEVVSLFDSTCGGTPVRCSDPTDITMTNLAAGTYYYVVDGYSTGTGAFTLTVSGRIANGQSCESALATSGALTCATGSSCQGTPGSRTCEPTP